MYLRLFVKRYAPVEGGHCMLETRCCWACLCTWDGRAHYIITALAWLFAYSFYFLWEGKKYGKIHKFYTYLHMLVHVTMFTISTKIKTSKSHKFTVRPCNTAYFKMIFIHQKAVIFPLKTFQFHSCEHVSSALAHLPPLPLYLYMNPVCRCRALTFSSPSILSMSSEPESICRPCPKNSQICS